MPRSFGLRAWCVVQVLEEQSFPSCRLLFRLYFLRVIASVGISGVVPSKYHATRCNLEPQQLKLYLESSSWPLRWRAAIANAKDSQKDRRLETIHLISDEHDYMIVETLFV